MITSLKNIVEKIPYSISKLLVFIPFKFRLGPTYSKYKNEVKSSQQWTNIELEKYIVLNFNRIFQHSKKFNLYKDKYRESGVLDLEIKSIDDIQKIPILEKEEVKKHFSDFKGEYLLNTGGTSGNPLAFYVDKQAWAREWAHMHSIWETVGYKHTDVKFTFRGKDLKKDFVKYNPVHNEFIINTYINAKDYVDEFIKILLDKKVKYFHGYPSAIYSFLKEIEDVISQQQKDIISSKIECCLLGSEYPTPQITSYLKNIWKLNYTSWYGHSEMCILASAEKNTTSYVPFPTYGYAEEVNQMLIGTSYHNYDMPLIRYNTSDKISPVKYDNGILKSFQISSGRIGDTIMDKNGKSISLTSLIFGRHHEIFKYADFIQVHQDKKGYATVIINIKKSIGFDVRDMMDLDNVLIEFSFMMVDAPVKTKAGKVSLKVSNFPSK